MERRLLEEAREARRREREGFVNEVRPGGAPCKRGHSGSGTALRKGFRV